MTNARSIALALVSTFAFIVSAAAQTATPTPPDSEILRVKTDLIQTGVSVTNKKGEFVTGLNADDFQLFVDGRPVKPLFFEPVRIGGGTSIVKPAGKASEARSTTALTDIVRTMVFLVDDLHMSVDSLVRSRKAVQRFVESEMLPGDRVAIIASSGKVGFLQQFTSDKDVLLKACDRLVYGQKSADEAGPPPMSEFDALSIDRGDRDVVSLFVNLTIRSNPGMSRNQAYTTVQARARAILSNARSFTQNTLGAIEASARTAAKFPGRKALYYFSDGMLLDPGNTSTPDALRKITDAAARANVVIYSFDAKGLEPFLGTPGVESPSMTGLGLSMQASFPAHWDPKLRIPRGQVVAAASIVSPKY